VDHLRHVVAGRAAEADRQLFQSANNIVTSGQLRAGNYGGYGYNNYNNNNGGFGN
jgi:hypothetical protein